MMKATSRKITEDIYWVGVTDWDRREYHGYTLNGTTYNSYLVFGEEKTVLIDNVYPGYSATFWGKIKDAFDKKGREMKIDYIIQNHVEKDHSGALTELVEQFPDATIYCSAIAKPGLIKHYPPLKDAKFETVGTGDSLSIGDKTFQFLDAKMLHWPDSMFTFLVEDGVLFSNDAFGQHICNVGRLDTDIPEAQLMEAAQKFYANLLTPLTPLLTMKLNEVVELGLLEQIKMIAPAHGQIWTDPMKIITAYTNWATGVCDHDQATLIYDTMHFSTQSMAWAIAEGLISEGVEVKMHFLKEDERSESIKDVLESKAVLLGVPTMFNKTFPSIGDIMLYLDELEFTRTGIKRVAATFGSYGWSGSGPKWLAEKMENAGFNVIDTIEYNYVPTDEELGECFDLGVKIAKEMKKI